MNYLIGRCCRTMERKLLSFWSRCNPPMCSHSKGQWNPKLCIPVPLFWN